MASWKKEDLFRLDAKYAQEGVLLHQRPFRAAQEILGSSFAMGLGNSEISEITNAYAEIVPEVRMSSPGAGVGLAVSVDQVRKITLAVTFGDQWIAPWQATGFNDEKEWWAWCRMQHHIATDACFALADLHDLIHGMQKLVHHCPAAMTLWEMAVSNLGHLAGALPTVSDVKSVVQPICLVAELAIKGTLTWKGFSEKSLRSVGHDLSALAKLMATETPHRDDPTVARVISQLPPYVESRYSPTRLTRLEVVRLALGVQFVAGSALRRVSDVDLAAQMEASTPPGPRSGSFFP